MWQCPKCGREFEKTNQQHFCSEQPETIDAYIAAQLWQRYIRVWQILICCTLIIYSVLLYGSLKCSTKCRNIFTGIP